MLRRRLRAAFTLVEMMFVLAMLAGLLALLYLIFHQQSSGAKKLDAHQEALRAGLFALENITRDLRGLVTVPPERGPDGQPVRHQLVRHYGDHRTPVRISPSGQQIAFFLPPAQLPGKGTTEVACVPVTYGLVAVKSAAIYTLRRAQ